MESTMRAFFATSAIVFCFASLADAQTQRQWARHHDGADQRDDYGEFVAVDSQKNTYLIGEVTNASGATEILTVKYDVLGQEKWSRTYAGPAGGQDFGWQVAIDPAGNAIVAGDSVGIGTDYDIVLLKYSPQGSLLWMQRYDGPASGYDALSAGFSLAVDSNGDVVVGGYSAGVGTGPDGVVLKYSAAGVLLWEARHNGTANGTDDIYGIRIDGAGNVYATGETTGSLTGRDLLTLKYSPGGALLWKREYDGPASGQDYVYKLALGPANDVAIVGVSAGIGTGNDLVAIHYDTDGSVLWTNRFNGAANKDDLAFGVAINNASQVAVTGFTEKGWESSAITLLYDTSGALLWSQDLDASSLYLGDDAGIDCDFDSDGNLFMVGYGWGGPEFGYETLLVEYSPFGQLLFEDVYDGVAHGDDFGLCLTLDDHDNAYVAGYSQRGSQHLDTLLLKYGSGPAFLPVPVNPPLPDSDVPPPSAKTPQDRPTAHTSPIPLRPGRLSRHATGTRERK